MPPTWPETIVFGHTGVRLENGWKTGFGQGEIAKGFWPPSETSPLRIRAALYRKLKRYNIATPQHGRKRRSSRNGSPRRGSLTPSSQAPPADGCSSAPPATQVTISSSPRLFGVACSPPSVPSCRQSGESQIPPRRRPWPGAWTTRQSPRSGPSLR